MVLVRARQRKRQSREGFAQEDIREGSQPNPGNREMPPEIENIHDHARVLTSRPTVEPANEGWHLLMIEVEARLQAADRLPLLRLMSQHELVYRPEHTGLAKKTRFGLTVERHFIPHLDIGISSMASIKESRPSRNRSDSPDERAIPAAG
jgi:hypothetical protein